MHVQLATLAQACVPQLREALRRLTVAHACAAQGPLPAAEAGADAGRATRATAIDWEETCFDVHQIHA